MVDQIREAIRCARIGPGTRLPSSRRLSEQLAISRNTVVRAYDLLLMEGIVESRPASGIYVAEQLPPHAAPMQPASDARRRRHAAAHADAAAAGARASRAPHRPQSPAVRFLSGPAQRRTVSAEDLAAPAAGQSVSWRRGGPDPVWRSGRACRRCAPRSPIIWWRRAASSPIPSRIVIVSGIQEGLTLRRGCSSPAARSAWSRIPAIRARRWRSRPPAPKSQASRSIRTG